MKNDFSPQDIELLLLYFTYSNQWGKVDTVGANQWALANMNMSISTHPFTITQWHVDMLCEWGALPDISDLIDRCQRASKIAIEKNPPRIHRPKKT